MSEADTPDEQGGDWESYADYAAVSQQVGRAVDEAVAGYAQLESMHVEGVKISDREAANARAKIQTAAIMLLPELEQNDDEYEKILGRWQGEEGFLERLDTVRLRVNCPDWLETFARDIRRVGFRLGYLQAGRYESDDEPEFEGSLTDDIL